MQKIRRRYFRIGEGVHVEKLLQPQPFDVRVVAVVPFGRGLQSIALYFAEIGGKGGLVYDLSYFRKVLMNFLSNLD